MEDVDQDTACASFSVFSSLKTIFDEFRPNGCIEQRYVLD